MDGKLYSNDEAFSTTYIYGRDLAEIIDTRIVSTAELQNYQRYRPDESSVEAVRRLVGRPYVFPPLYAIIVQLWARAASPFLNDPAVITRSCSALISLFSLPFFYWLCRELFPSPAIAWLGTAIFAVSPLHLQYSQIVRTYSLFTAAALLSSAALLKVGREPKRSNWILYALSVTLGLYSNVLFGFVAIAHALYIIGETRGKITRTARHYLYSTLLGVSLFLPWFYLFLARPNLLGYSVAQPVAEKLPGMELLQSWLKGAVKIFLDLNDPWVKESASGLWLQRIATPLVLFLVFVSLLFVLRSPLKNKHGMILGALVGGGGLLMLKDATLGGIFSTRPRYILFYTIGIQLATLASGAYLFQGGRGWRQRAGEGATAFLLAIGLLSCGTIARAPSWWAFGAPDYPATAREVNRLAKPVVLYDDFADALTMSYLLGDNVYSHLTRRAGFHLATAAIYRGYSDIVLFRPPRDLVERLRANESLVLEPLFPKAAALPARPNVWKVRRQDPVPSTEPRES